MRLQQPVQTRYAGHWRIHHPVGFGSAGLGYLQSSLHETWCRCHNKSYDGTHEVPLAIGRAKTRFHALKILTSGGRYQSGDRRFFADYYYYSQHSTN
jgi:hypothetical protein